MPYFLNMCNVELPIKAHVYNRSGHLIGLGRGRCVPQTSDNYRSSFKVIFDISCTCNGSTVSNVEVHEH